MEMSDRKNKITKMLLNVKYPTENEFNGAVDAFAKSKLELEEIQRVAETLLAAAQAANRKIRERAGVF